MKKNIYHYFIAHTGNNFQPSIFETKRFWFYSVFGLVIKAILVVFVVLLPTEAFLMPDILAVEESKIIMLTNRFRESENIHKLFENPKLSSSALSKAKDMSEKEYFGHISPEGSRLGDFLTGASYRYVYAGENLAIGFFDAEATVEAWKKSDSHRKNMLDPDYLEIGVGIMIGSYLGMPNVFIAQHFGRPYDTGSVASIGADLNQEHFINAQIEASREIELSPIKNSTADGMNDSQYSMLYKYKAIHHVLSDRLPVITFSKMIYLLMIVFFSSVLLLNMLIGLKMHHRHVIARSLALIGILTSLWLI